MALGLTTKLAGLDLGVLSRMRGVLKLCKAKRGVILESYFFLPLLGFQAVTLVPGSRLLVRQYFYASTTWVMDQTGNTLSLDDICDRLIDLEIDNYEHKQFVPYQSLEQLFTRETIHDILQLNTVKFYQISEIIEVVLRGGLRVFAILVSIRDVGSIAQFIKAERSLGFPLDAKLPLDLDIAETYIGSPSKRQAFIRNQWKFLAPAITSDQLVRELDERTVLPFTSQRSLEKNGGFGEIYAVKVHAEYHQVPGIPAGVGLHSVWHPYANNCIGRIGMQKIEQTDIG